MQTLIEELRKGEECHPDLFEKFKRAKDNLLRETKNYRFSAPHDVAHHNARLSMEENVWYHDSYVDVMEGEQAEKTPLTMKQCADVVQESLTGRLKVDILCMGNIDENGALQVKDVVSRHFLDRSQALLDAELPRFRSFQFPTVEEAQSIFGATIRKESIPIKFLELAYSDSEENNAVEVTFQAGTEFTLGYEGVSILFLLAQLARNSAYNQLRTKEQLGYIVSASSRKLAGGTWGMSVVVQSSSVSPPVLEERIEEWLKSFRTELESMDPNIIAMEAQGVVSQLLEEHSNLYQEVGSAWGEIVATQSHSERMAVPVFDTLECLADELVIGQEHSSTTRNGNLRKGPDQLKALVLQYFDRFCSAESRDRRALTSMVFSQDCKNEYDATIKNPGVLSSYSDMRYLKEFLSTWPVAPYRRAPTATIDKNC